MSPLIQIETGDRALLASVAAAMNEASRRSGTWLVCVPGCTPCCHGPFAITQLDALRLRRGWAALAPPLAAEIRGRAQASAARIAPVYPGDVATGELFDEDLLPTSLDEEPCPALDPVTGRCDLYEARPMTCRTFGPAARVGEGEYGACELCYRGATEEEVAACAVEPDPEGLEGELLEALARQGFAGETVVAFALLG